MSACDWTFLAARVSTKCSHLSHFESIRCVILMTFTIFFFNLLSFSAELECYDPLGMEDGAIEDRYIYANSRLEDSLPEYARLNHNFSWIPTDSAQNTWVKVYFPYQVPITGIITQGDERSDSWVKSFRVVYSLDHMTWIEVLDEDGEWEVSPGSFCVVQDCTNGRIE